MFTLPKFRRNEGGWQNRIKYYKFWQEGGDIFDNYAYKFYTLARNLKGGKMRFHDFLLLAIELLPQATGWHGTLRKNCKHRLTAQHPEGDIVVWCCSRLGEPDRWNALLKRGDGWDRACMDRMSCEEALHDLASEIQELPRMIAEYNALMGNEEAAAAAK